MIEYTEAMPVNPAPSSRSGTTWWLVARNGHLRKDWLTLDCYGGRTLPVFSSEDEAQMFVWLEVALEDDWRIRETSYGELVSILCGPCARVRSVALDPSPGMTKTEMIGLVIVTRERFLNRIVAPGLRTPGPATK